MSFSILQAATFPAGLREKIDPSLKVVGPFGFPVGATLTAEEAAEVRVLVTMGTLATDTTVMDRLPNLGLICCYGTGYEGVDLVAAIRRGIKVTHSPGANAAAVADHAIALLLAASRRIVMADRFVRDGRWSGYSALDFACHRSFDRLKDILFADFCQHGQEDIPGVRSADDGGER